jgi:hypothetical protein
MAVFFVLQGVIATGLLWLLPALPFRRQQRISLCLTEIYRLANRLYELEFLGIQAPVVVMLALPSCLPLPL